MKIKISELFKYRQYTETDMMYCFDKKECCVCDVSMLNYESDTPYQRFIPLLQIDEQLIQAEYLKYINDKRIEKTFEKSRLCFAAFIEQMGLQNDWWNYFVTDVFNKQREWCEKNAVKYIFDLHSFLLGE